MWTEAVVSLGRPSQAHDKAALSLQAGTWDDAASRGRSQRAAEAGAAQAAANWHPGAAIHAWWTRCGQGRPPRGADRDEWAFLRIQSYGLPCNQYSKRLPRKLARIRHRRQAKLMAICLGLWAPVWGSHLARKEDPADVHEASFDYNARVLQRAEDLGFSTVLVLDRSINSIKGRKAPVLEAWTSSAALAAVTSKIEIILASRSGFRHPALVAKMAADIDNLSGGRFAINIVSGWWQREFDMCDLPFPEHDERYLVSGETIEVLKLFWTEDDFDYEGKHYKVRNGILSPKPVRKPWPTIYQGGESPASRELGARLADTFLMNGRGIEGVGEIVGDMVARAKLHGRELHFGISAFVICRPTQEEAIGEQRRLEGMCREFEPITGLDPAVKMADLKEMADTKALAERIGTNGGLGAGLVGTPEFLAQRLGEFANVGVNIFLLQFHPMIEEMETFAAEVIPLLESSGLSIEGPPVPAQTVAG